MRTEHVYTMQYSDADASRHVRLCDLERYLLEAAGASADIMGFGTDYVLDKYNCAWVITRLTIQMDYLPRYLEKIRVETWVEGNMHMLSVRNYRVYLQEDNGERLIGQATSVWTLLGMESRQVEMKAFSDSAWEGKIDGERLSFARISRLGKIETPTSVMPHTIHYSDLDYNGHCNSCKYMQFFLNADDSLTATAPIRIDINYAKEVMKGDPCQIQVLRTNNENDDIDKVQYCMLTPDGEVSCTALIQRYTL